MYAAVTLKTKAYLNLSLVSLHHKVPFIFILQQKQWILHWLLVAMGTYDLLTRVIFVIGLLHKFHFIGYLKKPNFKAPSSITNLHFCSFSFSLRFLFFLFFFILRMDDVHHPLVMSSTPSADSPVLTPDSKAHRGTMNQYEQSPAFRGRSKSSAWAMNSPHTDYFSTATSVPYKAKSWEPTLERAIKAIVSIKASHVRSFDSETSGK